MGQQDGADPGVGGTDATVTLSVNGETHTVCGARSSPLLYALRNELGLVGTRFGCGVGSCGACMVLIDGRAMPSCDLPLWAAEGRAITTVEGLADGDRLSTVQEAFLEEQAAQCGYCLSGILISATALLAEEPRPSAGAVRDALDRNLCRCGTHHRMIAAVLRAAETSE